MNTLESWLAYLNKHQQSIAVAVTFVAVIATVASKGLVAILDALASLLKDNGTAGKPSLSRRLSGGEEIDGDVAIDEAFATGRVSPHRVARVHVVLRLNDAKDARAKEESSAKVSRILSGALTFAQVVIGGVLASSFVQESLPPKTVGVFGVLVLIASLVKQQYRPEVDAEQARQKASKLQALIRLSEDELATLDTRSARGEDRSDALLDLRNRISLGLTEIENPEAVASRLPYANQAEPSVEKNTRENREALIPAGRTAGPTTPAE